MKLLKLTLENFRVFHGTQKLDLEVSEDKPAVLIFGMNGAGKTTLLNAFTWALYGTFSDDVERQERVINDYVWAQTPFGGLVSASVKLEFEHEGLNFTVHRAVTTTKNADEQSALPPKLTVTQSEHGASTTVQNGQDRIQKILPAGLRQFFFFNGERMERMFTGDRTDEVQQAIKTLMGLEEIERAIGTHLPAASRKLSRQVGSNGDGRLQALTAEQDRLEQQKIDVHKELLQLSENAAGYEREVEAANRALLANGKAAPLQRQRAKLKFRLDELVAKRIERQERKRDLLAKNSFLAFTGGIDSTVLDLAEGMRKRRELPAGIQRDYIDGLLEDGQCMCGRDLPEGSEARIALEERRYNAGLADVESRWMYLRGKTADLTLARADLLAKLRECVADIEDIEASIKQIDAEMSDIARELEGVDVMDVQRLEERRKEFDRKRLDALQQHREAQSQLTELDEQIEKVRRQFHSARVQDEESKRIQRQVLLVDEVLDAFQRILAVKTEEVRQQLDAKVKSVFGRICIRPFTPSLTTSFALELVNHSAGVAAARSTGENQILGLSFVGAVSELTKETYDRKQKATDAVLGGGGVYPVVMDAPFGNLDVAYQNDIAESLPKLTSQIITLLSKSQSRGMVLEHLGQAASRMYVLRSYTTNSDADEDSITIHGREFPYVSHGEFNHTVLEEVTA
ncbi:ABC transporter ATP-binding protein [Streptomyces humidus]|uniref:Nuclease SbcCD subunit C n=1 Tax=Streptomyces humidus TaxID=52259 RepID=A0A918L7C0_9ACTN|nr:AAA family ATPase [Streptomyces humidus]GGS15258.1 ABC transporter ATP-binding protein [Streptomyces humidus]